jgi:hypothetical protein
MSKTDNEIMRLCTLTALKYNILAMTNGNLYGIGDYIGLNINTLKTTDLSNENLHLLYSDRVWNQSGSDWYLNDILNVHTPSSFKLEGQDGTDYSSSVVASFQNVSNTDNSVHSGYYSPNNVNSVESLNNSLNLFGIPYLKWDAVALEGDDKNYWFKYQGKSMTNKIVLNPLRREVLMRKAMTLGILAGIGLVSFYGGKYLYKNIRKKI